jgi:hypothetical protein
MKQDLLVSPLPLESRLATGMREKCCCLTFKAQEEGMSIEEFTWDFWDAFSGGFSPT